MIRTVRRSLIAAATAALIAASSIVGAPAARAEVDVYSTPGSHHVNGRDWRTTCEPYSATVRCRTEIRATVISYDAATARFSQKTDWAFNNLTYQPSSWAIWKGNPLAVPGSWTAPDGRQWITECNTAATGRNGCRSYAKVSVAHHQASSDQYLVSSLWVFNNIVRFTPGTMPDLTSPVTIPDDRLRACVTETLQGAPATPATLAGLHFLRCEADDLTGLEHAVNLTNLHLSGSYTDLTPISGLGKLYQLTLHDNAQLRDLRPLAGLTGLAHLTLRATAVTDFSPLTRVAPLDVFTVESATLTSLGAAVGGPNLRVFTGDGSPRLTDVSALATATGLETISLKGTGVAALPSLAKLPRLTTLAVEGSKLASLAPVAGHPTLREVFFDSTPVTDVSPLVSVPKLRLIFAFDNSVTNWTVLKPKFDAGGLQIFWFAPSDGYTPPW
ncbi:hypothetical protein GCM10025789_10370 [Tessaracoccus lubricantis]|uniref:Leucine-rich repeat domain-containing protein n=1 Tax=Tessaracoccus lubricantis TaxID=545543 RepID=A0ABP9F879_9ACTN